MKKSFVLLATTIFVSLFLSSPKVHSQFVVDLEGPNEPIREVICYGSSENRYFITATSGFYEYDKSGKLLKENANYVSGAAFNSKTAEFVFKGNGEKLILSSPIKQTSKQLPVSSDYTPLSFSENGEYLLTRNREGTLQLIETERWSVLLKRDINVGYGAVKLTDDGSRIVIGRLNRKGKNLIEVIDVPSGQTIARSAGLVSRLQSIEILHGSDKVVVSGVVSGKSGISTLDLKTLRGTQLLFALEERQGWQLMRMEEKGVFAIHNGQEQFIAFDCYSGRRLSLIHISEPTRPY